MLGTGGDDCKIILWIEKDCFQEFGSEKKIFSWGIKIVLSGH